MAIRLLIGLFLLVLPVSGWSQMRKFSANGSLTLKNYSPKTFGGNPQIFSITQDNRGLMYMANQRGVLEYDGTTWRTIPVQGNRQVAYVVTDNNGVVHVGADHEYGILKPDKRGKLHYHSLVADLKEPISSIGDIRKIMFAGSRKFVQTSSMLYMFDGDQLTKIKPETTIDNMFVVDDKLIIVQEDLGVFEVKGDKLVPIPEGHIFATRNVKYMTVFGGRTIIVTSTDGLYEIDKYDHIERLDILTDLSLFSGHNINDELLSIGTYSDGIRVLDKDLNLVYEVGLDNGIIDPTVKSQFFDRENNLWLSTNVGVSKVEIISPVLEFDKVAGLRSGIEDIDKFGNTLYGAALDGLYYFQEDGNLERVEGIETDCYGLRTLAVGDDTLLFIAEVENVIAMDKEGNMTNAGRGGPYDVLANPLAEDEIIVLHYDGIAKVKRLADNSFETTGYIRDFTAGEPFSFTIDPDGTIWIGTIYKTEGGIYKTHVSVFEDSTIGFKHYAEPDGLPRDGTTYLFEHDGEMFVGTDSGVYVRKGERFEPYPYLGVDFKKSRKGIHRMNADREGNVWMVLVDNDNNYEVGYSYKNEAGEYEWISKDFMRHADEIIHGIYHDEDGITWLGGPKRMMRFDSKLEKSYNIPFKTILRRVRYGNDTLFHGTVNGKHKHVELDYASHKSIIFNFSALSLVDEDNNEYSYKLEGYDNSWSEWSPLTLKEYSLSQGTYTFKVKARNIYGVESEVAEYTFTIHPPWYETTWAYIMYVVAFLAIVYLAIRFSIRRVKRQNQRLEKIVRDRTREVVQQKEEIEQQKELVEEKNRDIMDSIRYAKHIQDAILPSDEFVEECFEDAFVLFKPKDIVSGDFYWVKRKGNKVLFAAVDCTGHGVPGAFVSIVGNNGLNRAINEFGLLDPGAILDKLTQLVEEAFKQQGASDSDDVKDGMDIALCVLDLDTNTLQYSGANNPLYIIRDGELMETKADKQPIGSFDNRVPFTTHTFELRPQDRIFLFSDGYADQFGGIKGKKFKYRTFKNLLIDNRSLPVSDYKKILDTTFESWRGDYEQIDDVCVIGVQV